MKRLVFAFMQAYSGDERESLILAKSFRRFAGKLADSSLWIMVPNKATDMSETTRQVLDDLGVKFHEFSVPKDALVFPFGGKVYAAAAAETMAENEAETLIWMDSDTIFTGEPSEFILNKNIKLGYRPVMLENISSLYSQPISGFWEFIYKQCGTPGNSQFPMQTSIDSKTIRPHFNAGILAVQPKGHLLRSWRKNFERLYQNGKLTAYYQKHVLYRIFVHQAILAATILTMVNKNEMHDLGSRINVPLFLEAEPMIVLKAVTVRYDEFATFMKPGWFEKLHLSPAVKMWLQAQTG